jgi:hypothetical protein
MPLTQWKAPKRARFAPSTRTLRTREPGRMWQGSTGREPPFPTAVIALPDRTNGVPGATCNRNTDAGFL